MSVSDSYRSYVLDQLSRVLSGVRGRGMFGGVGVYSGPFFIALIADDTLYFKVDDGNRADFVARGMGPFRPFGQDGETMQYYEVPDGVLDDVDALRQWAEGALDAARRKQQAKKGKR